MGGVGADVEEFGEIVQQHRHRWAACWGTTPLPSTRNCAGIKVAPSTVWQILKDAGIDPASERIPTTWSTFLRSQASTLLACDFFETYTQSGTRQYVLAIIEHTSRQVRILGTTAHPTADWVTQTTKNVVMDLEDARHVTRFLIHDHDGKFPTCSTPSSPTRASRSSSAASRSRE